MTSTEDSSQYVGRFAPSPTGDLHFGSLIAAVGSYLQAKANKGRWLIRVEDIDPPREVEGSAIRIIDDLSRLGMKPDEPVLYQSTHIEQFQHVRDSLLKAGLAFECSCSRSSLPPGGRYPGTCRSGKADNDHPLSTRLKTDDEITSFSDGLQGLITENLSQSCGDFVIWRADDLPAYQLAVVVDDAGSGVTEIVRGADLINSTCRQIHLQKSLGLPTPDYIHLPVATRDGKKLGKRFRSDPVNLREPVETLIRTLSFLGHHPPRGLDLEQLWRWAIEHWEIRNVPAILELPVNSISVDSRSGQ